MTTDRQKLSAPFPAEDIEWRAGSTSKKTAVILPYVTARAVMDRLDAVVGIDNWTVEYHPAVISPGIECRISVWVADDREWVCKRDAAEPTQIEPVKGGYSSALKRAAVLWGIGRYLYRLPLYRQTIKTGWGRGRVVQIHSRGQHLGHVDIPTLPAWALPSKSPKIDGYEGSLGWLQEEVATGALKGAAESWPAFVGIALDKGWKHPQDWGDNDRRRFVAKYKAGEVIL